LYSGVIRRVLIKPVFNIIIVYDDQLDMLSGIDLPGLRAVYVFNVGHETQVLSRMQALGRVGRSCQGHTFTFVLMDKTIEHFEGQTQAEAAIIDSLINNSDFYDDKDVRNRLSIDHYAFDFRGADIKLNSLRKPSELEFFALMKGVKSANRQQVCRYMQYNSKTKEYYCQRLTQTYFNPVHPAPGSAAVQKKKMECQWYHPKPCDFYKVDDGQVAVLGWELDTGFCKKTVNSKGNKIETFRVIDCLCVVNKSKHCKLHFPDKNVGPQIGGVSIER